MMRKFFGGSEKTVNEPMISGVKTIKADGNLNMGVNSGQTIKHGDTNQKPDNSFPQADEGEGVNKPIIKDCGEITTKSINLGTGSGSTIVKGSESPVQGIPVWTK